MRELTPEVYKKLIDDHEESFPDYKTLDIGDTFSNVAFYTNKVYCYLCQWCGAVVVDTGAHSMWHKELTNKPPFWFEELKAMRQVNPDNPTLRF
jgi:hypothetical protein